MSINAKKIHSYSYLFVVTLVFSALATEFATLYFLFRENFWTPFEPLIIGIIICTSFSILGQRLSKINEIQRWIFLVSGYSTFLSYEIFLDTSIIIANRISYLLSVSIAPSFIGWLFYWEGLARVWVFVNQRKINKKRITVIISVGASSILAIFYMSIHFTEIVSFFDTHPWAMTFIGVLVTLLGGILIGRRTKKS